MRRVTVLVVLALSVITMGAAAVFAHRRESSVTVYDPNPDHPWNRLHSVFFMRDDLPSTSLVPDALDPPLWYDTQYSLAQPSHERVLKVLDDFLRTHAANLVHDPLKRAMLQRDLWAVFDWSVERSPRQGNDEHAYDRERQELQVRLAEIMRRVALTPEEIRALPDNYQQAVASGKFANNFDAANPDRAFLPPDLFDPHGPWVELEGPGDPLPPATAHISNFSGRSAFHVFMRLPAGRKAAFDYLQTLWNFPEPTIPSPNFAPDEDVAPNPKLPSFPDGTAFALVRQMILFDSQGNLADTPIIESVQIRVYVKIVAEERFLHEPFTYGDLAASSGQRFYEVALSRPQLFAHDAGGLRATGRDEKQYFKFGFAGPDPGLPKYYVSLRSFPPVLKNCVVCHNPPGLRSVNSRSRLLKPHPLQMDHSHDADPRPWWQDARVTDWKKQHEDWARLMQDWRAQ